MLVLMLMLRSSFVMEVMVLDIAMSFVRPCRSTQIHAYHCYPNLEGVLYTFVAKNLYTPKEETSPRPFSRSLPPYFCLHDTEACHSLSPNEWKARTLRVLGCPECARYATAHNCKPPCIHATRRQKRSTANIIPILGSGSTRPHARSRPSIGISRCQNESVWLLSRPQVASTSSWLPLSRAPSCASCNHAR